MISQVCLCLILLGAMPSWSQAVPSVIEGVDVSDDDVHMRIPPPISGEAYPTKTGSETRSNYLGAEIALNTAYNDNMLAGGYVKPVRDITYSIGTSFSFDQSSSRLHETFKYSPGFTLYQHTNILNASDQDVSLSFHYNIGAHAVISLTDSFHKMSNIFNHPFEGVPSSAQTSTVNAVAPFANHLSNTAGVRLRYQFSENGIIGGGGTSALVNYRNSNDASGLADSNSRGAVAFYSLRLPRSQYIGAEYQFSAITANSENMESNIDLHTFFLFYTIYFEQSLSLSVSGGPQRFKDVQSLRHLSDGSWRPTVAASISWQNRNSNLAVSYSRTVTGDGGLLGVYQSESVDVSIRWRMERSWTVGSSGSYGIQKNLHITSLAANPGGHTVSGSASAQHAVNDHLSMVVGYERLQQSYRGVAAIANAPDSNREYVSIVYQFAKLAGR